VNAKSQFLAEVERVVAKIRPLLTGRPSRVQGAILADLVATWLAGHFGPDDVVTSKLREELLDLHVETVRQLIPPNERMILETLERSS
jgi:hypothetical protein